MSSQNETLMPEDVSNYLASTEFETLFFLFLVIFIIILIYIIRAKERELLSNQQIQESQIVDIRDNYEGRSSNYSPRNYRSFENGEDEAEQENEIRRLLGEVHGLSNAEEDRRQEQESRERIESSRRLRAQKDAELQKEREKRKMEHAAYIARMAENVRVKKEKIESDLKAKEEERKRIRKQHDNEMAMLREENDRKEKEIEKEKVKQQIRREAEERRFEEEIRRVDEENRLKAEEFQKQRVEELARRNAYYDSILEELEKSTWSITIRTSFEARLNYLRSTPKRIQQYFWKLTDTLSSLLEHLQVTGNVNQALLRILMIRVADLQKALQYQADTMQAEISNLIKMKEKTKWPFLQDIKDSLIQVQKSCEQMLQNLSDNNFSETNTSYLESSKPLEKMNNLFLRVKESYAKIPSMGSLETKYKNENSSGQNQAGNCQPQAFYDEQGSIYYVSES